MNRLWLNAVRSSGRTYYIDPAGSDSANGLSPAAAWQTIGKINAAALRPGDRVLFKRGGTWTGTQLLVPAHILYFGAYGSGANPIIDGADTVDCISGNGKHSLHFENIEVTQGFDFGFAFDTEHDIILTNCVAHDCGNDNAIFSDCYDCAVSGGTYHSAYTRVNDNRFISGIEIKDTCHDILIDGIECYGNVGVAAPAQYGAGIAIHTHAGKEMSYNLTVQNCNIHDEGLKNFGIRVNNLNAAVMTDRNIIIQDNLIVDGAYGGIQINSAAGTAYRIVGVTVRNNRILTNAAQYGLSLMNCDSVTITRNVIVNNNDAQAAQNIAITDCTNIVIANNTTYSLFNNFWFSLIVIGATCANISICNNIFGGAVANMTNLYVNAGAGTTGLVIDYNLYQYTGTGNRWHWLGTNVSWTNWRAVNSNDAHSPTRANPLFTNPAADLTLQAGSPAINSGTAIAGVTDGYLGAAPDCGAYETA